MRKLFDLSKSINAAKNNDSYRKSVKNTSKVITEIHDLAPDAFFHTMTSGIAFGWVIKYAYKEAWSKEKQPKFYTIQVKMLEHFFNNGQHYDVLNHWIKNGRQENFYLPEEYRLKVQKYPYFEKTKDTIIKCLYEEDLPDKILIFEDRICDGVVSGMSRFVVESAASDLGCGVDVYVRSYDFCINQIAPWTPFGIKNIEEKSQIVRYTNPADINLAISNVNTLKSIGKDVGKYILENHLEVQEPHSQSISKP